MMKKSLSLFGALTFGAASLTACIEAPSGSVILQPVPVSVPVLIQSDRIETPKTNDNQAMHVCKINAFTYTYRAEDTNRGKAKLSAKKQCLAKFDEMFCRDEDISCQEYK